MHMRILWVMELPYSMVDLFGTNTWEEAVARVKEFADKHPDLPWIQGRGWDQNKWPGKTYPTNEALNKLFPDKPVVLKELMDMHRLLTRKRWSLQGSKPDKPL
jgi:predicted amidohydrolase YtcJ